MTPLELREHIRQRDALTEQFGLKPDGIVQLEFILNKVPSGSLHVRTPFGYGRIINCREFNGKWHVVANVKRKNVEKFLKGQGV